MRPFYTLLYVLLLFGISSCNSTYKLSETKSENTVITNDLLTDSITEAIISPYKKQLGAQMNEVLNTSMVDMETGSPEGILGNFIADLTMARAVMETNGNVDFCVLNNGGLRTSIDKGDITRGKIYEVMPFQNEIVIVEISGDKMVDLINYVKDVTLMKGTRKSGVPISNIRITILGSTISEVLVAGIAFNKTKTYKIATSDYLASGGDNMVFFLNPISTTKTGILLRDAILEHIIDLKKNSNKVSGSLDGRVQHAE